MEKKNRGGKVMKIIKRTLIILIIATTIFTVVKCNRIEDVDNIKQEQGKVSSPKDNKEDEQDKEKHKDNKPEEKDQEEIEYPVELR